MPSPVATPPHAPLSTPYAQALLIVAAWALLVVVGQFCRPLLPIDETRYLSVAWEIWRSGDWLVMHVNGAPYPHKPPMLFWLINLGWTVLGPQEWWGRLVAPLFGLATLFTTAALGRRLWPGELGLRVGRLVPMLLLGGLLWTVFTTLTMFDTLVAFFAVLGMLGLVTASRGRLVAGMTLTGIAIGLGVLSKGPVILVYLLPAAVLAPLWLDAAHHPSWRRWYLGVLWAVLLGAGIGLAWALPAAYVGGPEYADQILWHQTSGRMVQSFAHRRPFWWYLPLLPLLLFPWAVWPPLWRGLGWAVRSREAGLRLCLIWFGASLLIFSAISGKQVHYLLPIFPAAALLLARWVAEAALPDRSEHRLAAGLVLLLGALLVAAPMVLQALPRLAGKAEVPDWAASVAIGLGASLLVLAVVAWFARPRAASGGVTVLAGLSLGVVLLVHLVGFPKARSAYDLAPAAAILHNFEAEGRPIAYAGEYHAEFQYLGRLHKPIETVKDADLAAWAREHPNGVVVETYSADAIPDTVAKPVFSTPQRGRILMIWDGAAFAADPHLFG